jgi:formylglycine-generating enzyme required for sulfatase activity
VRSYATNSLGTSYGKEKVFKTTAYDLPSVDSVAVTNIGVTQVSLSSNLKNAGSAPKGEKGFVYSKTLNPTIADSKYTDSTYFWNGSSYSTIITNLAAGTLYHVRAYAKNPTGIVYSADKVFTTLGYSAPKLDTTQVSNIGYTYASLNSYITSDGGKTVSEGGFVYATKTGPTISDTKVTATLTPTNGTYYLYGYPSTLIAGQTYYVRSYATNSLGTSYGKEKVFKTTTYDLPSVDSVKVTNIGVTLVSLSSNLKNTGSAPNGEKGFVYSKTLNPTIADSKYTDNTNFWNGSSYSTVITNLVAGTLYHVRAYAKNQTGIVYSADRSFTTFGYSAPKMDSTTVSGISYNYAYGDAYFSDGGKVILEDGFVYSPTNVAPTINDTKISIGSFTPDQNGHYELSGFLNNLIAGTTYYIRSYARNSLGTSYSPVAHFSTLSYKMPVIDTLTVGDVSQTTADLISNVVTNGNDPTSENGFVYGDNSGPTIANTKVLANTGQSNGRYSYTLTGLSPSHTYYVRSYIKNSIGISYSSEKKITTSTPSVPVIELVNVQGGTFQMGSNDSQDGAAPVHSVTLSDFYMGKNVVTQAQWKAVMGNNPSYFKGDNLPVEQVSWNDVQDFLSKLNTLSGKNYRLPTEAEWEYAARGGSKSQRYTYSGSNTLSDVAWYVDNSGGSTHAVGTKQPNELGLYDMSGNVWEWCSDWYGDYSSDAQTNPTGPISGSDRVSRGGGWADIARICRTALRYDYTPGIRNGEIGFRLCSSK